jgi:hypothetical protein
MPNSEANSGALRRVWQRLLVFLATVAIGWGGLDWGMSKVPNSASLKRERLQILAGEIDTLVLGSSETYYGVSAHALEGTAFNLANTAQSLYYDYELAKRALPELPKLSRVLILVNYMSLYMELYNHPDSTRIYQYYQEWGIPMQRVRDYVSPNLVSRVALYSPHKALEALMVGFNTNIATTQLDDRGWYRVPDEDRWGLTDKDARGRLAVHHGFMRQEYLLQNRAVLEQLLDLLRQHGIEAVMLTTPVWDTYRANIRQEQWQPAKATIEELARMYGAIYLDFQHEPRLVAADFEDADHLNADGAVHFARILNEKLGAPTVRLREPAEAHVAVGSL